MQLVEKKISSNIEEFNVPKMNLPPDWTFAISTGMVFYYHVKIRIPQWEPPIFFAPLSIDEKKTSREESFIEEIKIEQPELQVEFDNVETEDVSSEGESFFWFFF